MSLLSSPFATLQTLTFAFVVCLSAELPSMFSGTDKDIERSRMVADRALQDFRKHRTASLVDESSLKASDFDIDDAPLRLAPPFPCFSISLEDAASFVAGTKVEDLIKPARKVIYPVQVKNAVLGGITVQESNREVWSATSFPPPDMIRSLSTARRDTTNSLATGDLPFLVQMRALDLQFLAIRTTNGAVYMRPLIEDRALNLSTNTNYRAEAVFEKLAPMARAYKKPETDALSEGDVHVTPQRR